MAFITVGDYLTEAQALAEDVGAIRYPQTRWMQALNSGLDEAFRLRPDFFRDLDAAPYYSVGSEGTNIVWPAGYTFALLLYIVGHVTLTDNEGNSDQRVAALVTTFAAKLTKGST